MSQTFLRWLARFPTRREAVIVVAGLFVADWAWSLLVANTYIALGIAPEPIMNPSLSFLSAVQAVAFAAVSEELVFRIVPLSYFIKNCGIGWKTIRALVISSILFGLIHGDVRYVLIQGVSGLMFGVLFIKFSDKGTHLVLASSMAIAIHFLFDLSALMLNHVGI